MPNIKSAKKRVKVIEKKTEQNKIIRSEVKTEIKKILALIKENNLEKATASLPVVFSAIDSACSKNIFHANKASNLKSKIAKKLDAAKKVAGVVVEEAKPEVKEEVKVEEVKTEVVEEKPVAKKTTTAKKATTAKKTTTKKTTAKEETKAE